MPLPRPTRQPQSDNPLPEVKISPNFRPSDVFRFEPKSDITIEELGYLVSIFWTLDVDFTRFSGFEEDLQRHFRPIGT